MREHKWQTLKARDLYSYNLDLIQKLEMTSDNKNHCIINNVKVTVTLLVLHTDYIPPADSLMYKYFKVSVGMRTRTGLTHSISGMKADLFL